MSSRAYFLGIGIFAIGVLCRTLYVIPWTVLGFAFVFACIFVCAGFYSKKRIYTNTALLGLLFVLGALRTSLVPVAPPQEFQPLFNTDITMAGVITGDPDVREANQRVSVEIEKDGAQTKILAVAPLYPELSYGDRVTVKGTLEVPEAFDTDGGRTFAYDHFLAKDGIFGIVNDAHVAVTGTSEGLLVDVQRFLYGAKHVFMRALSKALPEPYDGLAAGIIAGGKQGLGKEIQNAFTVAGLLPIIVLSGYNVMIIAESILRSLSFLPKRFALLLAAISITGFVLACGGGSSAVRAGLMAGLALFARATGRTYDVLRALGFVALVMLLFNPLLLVYDPGFQFSFMATVGLIIGTPIMERYLLWMRNAFMREIVSTTLAAQCAVLPILLYQTGNLSLVSVPANILILPFVPLTMLLSFIAAIIALIVPPLAAVAGLPAFVFLWYTIRVAIVAAHFPLAEVIVPAFSIIFVLISYVLLALVVVHVQRRTAAPLGAAVSIPTT